MLDDAARERTVLLAVVGQRLQQFAARHFLFVFSLVAHEVGRTVLQAVQHLLVGHERDAVHCHFVARQLTGRGVGLCAPAPLFVLRLLGTELQAEPADAV